MKNISKFSFNIISELIEDQILCVDEMKKLIDGVGSEFWVDEVNSFILYADGIY